MLIALRASDNTRTAAFDATRANAPFTCPECQAVVTLLKGSKVTPHFAHARPDGCAYARGETNAHRFAKLEIYHALRSQPAVSEVILERPLGTVRADIFARINGTPVAIEVQNSTLSPEQIAHRTEEYTRQGIFVLWLLFWSPKLDTPHYSPRRFERWLHALYFGRVYVWREWLSVIPIYFREHETWVSARKWQDERGRVKRASGYRKTSKRYKIAVRGSVLNIIRDFHATTRTAWQSKSGTVPKANLFMDRQRPDWN